MDLYLCILIRMNSLGKKNVRILLVDDDTEILDLLSNFLATHGYSVDRAENTQQVDAQFAANHYHIVILDIMLPGEDGLSICKRLRSKSDVPIVMLTALGDETDRIVGLEIGADDYLPKPFNPRELLARIKAVLRRYNSPNGHTNKISRNRILKFDIWSINLSKRELKNNNNVITSLTSGEYELLLAFADNSQHILTRDQLLDITRGRHAGPFDRSIDVQLSRLRKKIEPDPKNPTMIKTVRNGGYIFTPAVKTIS